MPESVPEPISDWLQRQGRSAIVQLSRLGGGSIAAVYRADLGDGSALLLKSYGRAASGMIEAEARGLQDVRRCGALRVPAVLYRDRDWLVLEFIHSAAAAPDFWQRLGEGLAQQHLQPAEAFGYPLDSYCGSTRQPNERQADGYRFFAEHRLRYGCRLCHDRGLLDSREARAIETIAANLSHWLPDEVPALLHGDLWSGNVLTGAAGEPVLIDPAVYWGWPEADIAMTCLFGGFDEAFYDAYQNVRPLLPGWERRMELYNLWHLLNHLYLFGTGYRQPIHDLCRRYGEAPLVR